MLRTVIIFFLILTSINTYSQKCKTEKDPFTNEEITSFDYINKTVYFEIRNDTIRLDVKFQYWGEREHEFSEGAEILLKLKNDSKIKLKSINKAKPKIESITSSSYAPVLFGFGGGSATNSRNYTAYSFTFLLNKTELNRLAESKIDIIRIPDTDDDEHIDLEAKGVTKKKINAIRKGALCLSEKI